jgi:hypothetical protein
MSSEVLGMAGHQAGSGPVVLPARLPGRRGGPPSRRAAGG